MLLVIKKKAKGAKMETIENDSIDLLQVLCTITPLSSGYQQKLKSQLQTEHYSTRTLLLQPGDICRKIYFVSRGMVRIYSVEESGRERTHLFMGAGELVIDVASFFEQSPATEYLETLQETTLQSLSWQELNALYADFPEGNYVGRLTAEKYLVLVVRRNWELLNNSLYERYQALLTKYPYIEQMANQSQIASYLNISRETLSRLKRELLRQRRQTPPLMCDDINRL